MRYNQPGMSIKPPETREVIWPFDEEIKASGWLRARDYGHVTLLCRKSQIRTPFLIAALVWLVLFAAVLILAAAFEVKNNGWSWPPVVLGALPFVGVYLVFFQPYVQSARSDRQRKKLGVAPTVWTFSKNGIHAQDTHAVHQMGWSLATNALITKRYVMLQLGGPLYHTFAASMFSSPSDWHNFRAAIIRNFIGCRGCKYDLHGTTSDACPECGKPIEDRA